ncbi:unnamed protein product [Caenorhabditis angaria]|uniref:PHD-type domain-containing protein n=1 Tax=Caenorhabditis angaria TaxID=860376 RepID=A0A9P1N1Z9_9PELO|nr:unnamed protein product [Caenorhabditis angaria]
MSSVERTFGSEIGNTMTASQTTEQSSEVSLVKKLENNTETEIQADTSMEKPAENGSSKPGSLMGKVLAVEVYSLIQQNHSSEEDLLDDLEDLLDDGFFIGEFVLNSGKEYEVKSKEKRGGMTLYTMTDGSKIGNRDLKRRKGINKDYLKGILEKDAKFDGKTWKVSDEVTQNYQLKQKLAPIFTTNTPKSAKKEEKEESSDEEEEDERPKIVFQGRVSVGAQPSKKALLNQQKKLEKEKEKAEKKKIAEEEKKKKIEEKKKEMEEKKKEKEAKNAETKKDKKTKNGNLDAFLKKSEDSSTSPGKSAPIFSQQKAAQRLANGIKKLEEAWNKRDQEAFTEACQWCEKQLSGIQVTKIENELWRYSVQKMVDKTKDQNGIKSLKGEKRQEFRTNVIDKRKELYKVMDPKIRAHFSEDWSQDDLIIAAGPAGKIAKLDIPKSSVPLETTEFTIDAMEITQFFVAMSNLIGFTHDVSIARFEQAIQSGSEGFKDCLYHMYESLILGFLMDSDYRKLAHANIRLAEFKCNENTISEMFRAFFIGEFELVPKKAKSGNAETNEEENQEPVEKEERMEIDMEQNTQQEIVTGHFSEEERQKVLSWLNTGMHLQNLTAPQHIELLQLCIRIMLQSDVIREYHQRDVVTEELTECKDKIKKLSEELEEKSKELAELPPAPENMEELSRTASRDAAVVEKKRERLERNIEELRDSIEQWQNKLTNERLNIQRCLRTFFIGEDRHFRRYYRLNFNSDSGLWIQDFGTTSYEKWAMQCTTLGMTNFENQSPEKLPEHIQENPTQEKWFKIIDEESLKQLETSLFEKGVRERNVKKYLQKNIDSINMSVRKYADKQRSASRSNSPEITQNGEEEEDEDEEEETEEPVQTVEKIEFSNGEFFTIKTSIQSLCQDLEESEIFMAGKTEEFDKKLENANSLKDIKEVLVDFVQSVNSRYILERIPMKEALQTKQFSCLFIPRFTDRIRESISTSALHLLLDFFDSRIDRKRTIKNQPCKYCKRKTGNAIKLMCQGCSMVIHSRCVRPKIANYLLDNTEYRSNWMCNPCNREKAARLKREAEKAEKEENAESDEDEDEEEVEEEEEEEEEENGRKKRKAKRKANEAIHEAMTETWKAFEAKSRNPQQQQQPPTKKKPIEPEIRELFESIEMSNPRLYKTLQKVNVHNGYGGKNVMSLSEIEEKLSTYSTKTIKKLRTDIIAFLNVARDEMEDSGSRKLDDVDELISKFDV